MINFKQIHSIKTKEANLSLLKVISNKTELPESQRLTDNSNIFDLESFKDYSSNESSANSKENEGSDCEGDGDGEGSDQEWSDQESSSSEIEYHLKPDSRVLLKVVMKNKETINFRYQDLLAKGAYGAVIKYQCITQPKNTLAVKVGFEPGSLRHDVNILNHLNGVTSGDHLIKATVVPVSFEYEDKTIDDHIILMQEMDGDVKELFKNQQFSNLEEKYKFVLKILTHAAQAFSTLLKQGIYYTDIKLANLLYRWNENGALDLALGDIGSAFLENSHEAIATYPSLYRRRCHHFRPQLNDLVYGLLIIFFEMMSIGPDSDGDDLLNSDLVRQLYFKQLREKKTVDARSQPIKMIFNELESIASGNNKLTRVLMHLKKLLFKNLGTYTKYNNRAKELELLQYLVQMFQKLRLLTASVEKQV